MDEKLAYHKSINVFFQANPWIDTDVFRKWINTKLSMFIKDEKLLTFLLLLDHLSCQESHEFKEKVSAIKRLCWYGLTEGTDLWQPVDAGDKDILKKLVGIQQRKWLDNDENADRWYDGKSFSAKEGRILTSHWDGEAWDQLCQPKYDHLRLKCWAFTGGLLTADGSDDHLVKPEGLPKYAVPPPPPLCEPINGQPIQPQLSAPESGDEDDLDENENSVEKKHRVCCA